MEAFSQLLPPSHWRPFGNIIRLRCRVVLVRQYPTRATNSMASLGGIVSFLVTIFLYLKHVGPPSARSEFPQIQFISPLHFGIISNRSAMLSPLYPVNVLILHLRRSIRLQSWYICSFSSRMGTSSRFSWYGSCVIFMLLCLIASAFSGIPPHRSQYIPCGNCGASPNTTHNIQGRALNLVNAAAIGGGWSAKYLKVSLAMPATVAAHNLLQLYDGILQLTQPGAAHGPLSRHFQFALGNLEIVLAAVDPANGVPWDLVYAFVLNARARAAFGFAGLYYGYLRNTAGQSVYFALQPLPAPRMGLAG